MSEQEQDIDRALMNQRVLRALVRNVEEARNRVERALWAVSSSLPAFNASLGESVLRDELFQAKRGYLRALEAIEAHFRAAPPPPSPWYESRANLLALLIWRDSQEAVLWGDVLSLLRAPEEWVNDWAAYCAREAQAAALAEPPGEDPDR